MQLTKLNDNIYLFTSKTVKELTLTFFRVQEYYESQLKELNRAKFNTFDFLDASMEDDGTIEYFSYWTGFNIPGDIVNEWWAKQDVEHATPYELKLFSQLKDENLDFSQPYYIIGALASEKDVIKHEIAHALYHTNVEYNKEMFELTTELMYEHNIDYLNLRQELKNMGYCEEVLDDEVQAYLASEKKRYLMSELSVNYTNLSNIIKRYRKVLQKYNTFDI
jgi:hypothetical protein